MIRVEITGESLHFLKRGVRMGCKLPLLYLGRHTHTNGSKLQFFQGDHESPNCPVFNEKSLDDRWELVQENKLCFNFLKVCNQKHFSTLSALWQIVAAVIMTCCMVSSQFKWISVS